MMDRKRCCCNCRHNIRVKEKNGYISTHCEIDNHSISYVQCFNGWCRHWASDAKKWQEKNEAIHESN